GVKFTGATQDDSGVRGPLESGDTIEADLPLVAVGRGPVTAGRGHEGAGVPLDGGLVAPDERRRTAREGVRAGGDHGAGPALAHRGCAPGISVAEQIAGLEPTPIDETGIPRVTYCGPEIASVGLTEQQAREKHGEVTTYEYNLGGNGKSQILGT